MPDGLRPGQLAAAAGVNQQTLRYYERRGLLAEPARTPGGHRTYPAEAVTLLRAIKTAQRLGFSLAEVAELLDTGRPALRRRAEPSLPERARVKLAEVEGRIAELTTVADTLRAALSAGCADLVECAETAQCPLPSADPVAR
ncbi:MerR family transcriptional regulator [Plantactinospora endophytica]|uniref:Cu(I)-responsive transcriptional regulator n=1 Tax=Plantactinospora endophytica TaxID=673535 RepID=A0ABQ4EDT6_9ACTN|nr:MerR family transcriptional regulator [Plantactinospora endophytica]GIG92416.1 Cu(I)-responsive transcriptional regulator [Plantactinospora endophytica]